MYKYTLKARVYAGFLTLISLKHLFGNKNAKVGLCFVLSINKKGNKKVCSNRYTKYKCLLTSK